MIKNIIKYIIPLIFIPFFVGISLYYYTLIPISYYSDIDTSIKKYKELRGVSNNDNRVETSEYIESSLETNFVENKENDLSTIGKQEEVTSPFTKTDNPDGYIKTVDSDILPIKDIDNKILTPEEFRVFKEELKSSYTKFEIDKMNWSELIEYGSGVWESQGGDRIVLQGESISINDVVRTVKDTSFNGRVVRLELSNGTNIDLDIIDHRMMVVDKNIMLNPISDQTLSGPYGVFVDKGGRVLTIDVNKAKLNNNLISEYFGYSDIEGGGFFQVYNENNRVIVYPAFYDKDRAVLVTKDGVFTQIY